MMAFAKGMFNSLLFFLFLSYLLSLLFSSYFLYASLMDGSVGGWISWLSFFFGSQFRLVSWVKFCIDEIHPLLFASLINIP